MYMRSQTVCRKEFSQKLNTMEGPVVDSHRMKQKVFFHKEAEHCL